MDSSEWEITIYEIKIWKNYSLGFQFPSKPIGIVWLGLEYHRSGIRFDPGSSEFCACCRVGFGETSPFICQWYSTFLPVMLQLHMICEDVVLYQLGTIATTLTPFSMEDVYQDSSCITPIVFFLPQSMGKRDLTIQNLKGLLGVSDFATSAHMTWRFLRMNNNKK